MNVFFSFYIILLCKYLYICIIVYVYIYFYIVVLYEYYGYYYWEIGRCLVFCLRCKELEGVLFLFYNNKKKLD